MTSRLPESLELAGDGTILPANLQRRHRHERRFAALLVFLLSVILFAAGALEPVENHLSELRSELLSRHPTGQIAIVEIDAKSLQAITAWPWSRRYHAQLVDRLGAAKASLIAFDVDFSAHSDAAGDAEFGRALEKVQPVILPIFQQRSSALSDDMIKSRPAQPFGLAWVGGVNIIPGHDGVVRDFPAATLINGQAQPAMAALLADNGDLGDRTFIPDWSIDAREIPRFSFIDVMQGRVPSQALAGKRIIVGATAIEMGDRYTIPRFGTVPGVVIQALAAETLLQHRALKRSGLLPSLGGLVLLALLVSARYGRIPYGAPLAAATVLAALLGIPLAVQARIPLSVDTAPLLFAAVLGICVRTIVEVRHRIRVAALRDAETGLPNAIALEAALTEAGDVIVTVASMERFEAIRGAIGTAATAETIRNGALRIAQTIGATVYRIGADSLAWVSAAGVVGQSDEIAQSFIDPVATEHGPIDVQWTLGMARKSNERPSGAIEQALVAVDVARAEGRSSSWFKGAPSSAVRDLSIMGELRRGLESGQLFVAYQPKLGLKTGTIAHAEALIRWQHPTDGLVPPDRFLPLAEETGAVREITRFVLRRVLADLALAENAALSASINISAADIGDPDFAENVIDSVSRSGVEPARLTLEITESAIIRSPEAALETLEKLRAHGLKLSIDDYGTGQSTLSYVKTLPVHELKIDKCFVTSLRDNHADRIMVRSTIDLAHALDLTVVAEGVEDWDTAKLLADLGCDYAQGFVIGRAVDIGQFRTMSSTVFRKAA